MSTRQPQPANPPAAHSNQQPLLTHADLGPLWQAARQHEAAMIAGDGEALHQYRRQLRRLRSWLGLQARLQPELRLDESRNLLRQMMARAAANRDHQVAASLLQQRAQGHEQAAALHQLAAIIAKQQQDWAELGRWLHSSGYQQQCATISATLDLLPPLPAGQPWLAAMHSQAQRISKLYRQLDEHRTTIAQLHRLRLRLKRLLNRIERLAPHAEHWPAPLRKLQRQQRRLGLLHDQAVLLHLLETLAHSPDLSRLPPATLITLGSLLYGERQTLAASKRQLLRKLRASKLAQFNASDWQRQFNALRQLTTG